MIIGFHRIDGQICCDGIALEAIAAEFGSPLYVYSAAAIEAAYSRFDRAVCNGCGVVHFAVKSNSNLAILRLLARLGAGADIVSGGEMQRALKAGFAPEKIIFSGVGKTDQEIEAALEAGIGQINAESLSEVERVLALARNMGRSTPCRLGLRINPDVATDTHAKISTGKSDTKFGVPTAEAADLYRRIATSGVIEPAGLAVHIGSQIMDEAPFEAAWIALLDIAEGLREDGFDVPMLDLGGGLGIDYRDGTPADADALGAAVTRVFGNRPYRLGFEPGRYLLAEAGVLLTRVLHSKPATEKTFAIVDGAMNDLIRPTLYEAWHRIEPVSDTAGAVQPTDIVGPVCETGDYLGLGHSLPPLQRGDLLAVRSAGAYGAVMRSNYNTRPFAAEILIINGEARPISVQQTVADLLAQDRIPPELQ